MVPLYFQAQKGEAIWFFNKWVSILLVKVKCIKWADRIHSILLDNLPHTNVSIHKTRSWMRSSSCCVYSRQSLIGIKEVIHLREES